jgi:MGT family glycosyltransferase
VPATTVVFFPEGAYGPTNNCVGIGQVLRDRGVRVVFVIEESFAGTLQAHGFEERLMRLGPPPAVPEQPGQFWKEFIRETAPAFRTPTIKQLQTFIAPTTEALMDGARYVDDRLREILAELDPDIVVEDNVVSFPAVMTHARRWARIVSCNPAEVKDPCVPPLFSGYAAASRDGWEAFWQAYDTHLGGICGAFDAWCQSRGAPPLGARDLIHDSPYLNLYLYPAEADYPRQRPLDQTWHRIDSCVRRVDAAVSIPDEILRGDGALVYLSLGSLGSADVGLMQRLIDVLADSPHRVIVSIGPQAQEITLRGRMWGEEFLPQPVVLPLCDVVITHAGNNTTTECWHHGKPMVTLPLFWDQYDNAQRVEELGLGRRLETYAFAADELLGAVDQLTGDRGLHERLAEISARLQRDPGTVRAADLILAAARA